jgi:hypothetical protein
MYVLLLALVLALSPACARAEVAPIGIALEGFA